MRTAEVARNTKETQIRVKLDLDGRGVAKLLAHIVTQGIPQAVGIPAGAIQEVLHGIRRGLSCLFGQLPAIFAFHWTQ